MIWSQGTCKSWQVEDITILKDPVGYRRGFHLLAISIAALAALVVITERLWGVTGATYNAASAPQTAPSAVSESLASIPPHPLPLLAWWFLLFVTVVASVLSYSRAAIMKCTRSRLSKMYDDLVIAVLHAALFAAYWEACGVWVVLIVVLISFLACLLNMRRAHRLGNRPPYMLPFVLRLSDWQWSAMAEVVYSVALLIISGRRLWQMAGLPLVIVGVLLLFLRTVSWGRCAIADVAEYISSIGRGAIPPTLHNVNQLCGEGVLEMCSLFGYTTKYWKPIVGVCSLPGSV